jgi:predicted dehydrogenase
MIRIGVAGCGYWGPLHIRVFNDLPGACVTVAADLSPERRAHVAAVHPRVRTVETLAELLAGPVDAVVLSTPARTHGPLGLEVLAAGKHLLVEKPLAASAAEARALIAAAAARGLVLMTGHTFLYHAAVRRLRDMVRGGDLGDLYYVDSTRVNLGLHRKDVDVVWDLGAHDVSILRHVLGVDPLQARSYGAAFHDPAVAEVAYVELRYPRAVLANLHLSWLDPVKVRRMTVVGSRRMAVWDDVEPVEKLRLYDRGMERAPYYDDYGQWQVAYRHGDGEVVPLAFEEPLRTQGADFLGAIRGGGTPVADGAGGLAVVETLERATAAMRLGPTPVVHERPGR